MLVVLYIVSIAFSPASPICDDRPIYPTYSPRMLRLREVFFVFVFAVLGLTRLAVAISVAAASSPTAVEMEVGDSIVITENFNATRAVNVNATRAINANANANANAKHTANAKRAHTANADTNADAKKARALYDIIWMAPFFSGGGYSSEAISFAVALHRQKHRVHIVQHGDAFHQHVFDGLDANIQKELVFMSQHVVPPQGAIVVCHSQAGAWYPALYHTSRCPPADAKYKVGRTMFETDRLPHGWRERLQAMDLVIVPTEFQRRIFVQGGVSADKLAVVGEAVDSTFYDPSRIQQQQKPQQQRRQQQQQGQKPYFRFLSVFKWEERKGWQLLLEAFCREFAGNTRVSLTIKTASFHSTVDFRKEIQGFATKKLGLDVSALPVIQIEAGFLSEEEMAQLYASCDAFVLPSRGEGWGRPHVEAMSMALPVIATNWSGPTEYLNQQNGYPIRVDALEPIPIGQAYADQGHRWARPSVPHLRELMRHVVTFPDEAKRKGKQARRDMLTYYQPAHLARKFTEALQQILYTCVRNIIDMSCSFFDANGSLVALSTNEVPICIVFGGDRPRHPDVLKRKHILHAPKVLECFTMCLVLLVVALLRGEVNEYILLDMVGHATEQDLARTVPTHNYGFVFPVRLLLIAHTKTRQDKTRRT